MKTPPPFSLSLRVVKTRDLAIHQRRPRGITLLIPCALCALRGKSFSAADIVVLDRDCLAC